MLRMRRWTVFNALRKPERTVVNFHSRDFRSHGGGFAQVPESLWKGGRSERTADDLWLGQPLQFDIHEESNQIWYIYARMAYKDHPPPWMRRFIRGLEDASWDLVFKPLEPVHKPYPKGLSQSP